MSAFDDDWQASDTESMSTYLPDQDAAKAVSHHYQWPPRLLVDDAQHRHQLTRSYRPSALQVADTPIKNLLGGRSVFCQLQTYGSSCRSTVEFERSVGLSEVHLEAKYGRS